MLILLLAIATRWAAFGNPAANQDDQFYLLVGDALRHGQWPYVDVWDRKPLGLFALFAAIAALFGKSILAVQLVATAFAAATAWLIRGVALRFAGPAGALLAALAYLLTLVPLGGQTGQSPVFYNLLMIGAFALLLSAVESPAAVLRRRALWAMLLCGLALTIKPVSVAEGVFIGLAFLWLLRRTGAAWLPTAAAMVGVALLPSLLGLAVYAAKGPSALDAYTHANFVSILAKQGLGREARLAGFGYFALYLGPLLLVALLGLARRWRERREAELTLLAGWLAAALIGYLLVPNFFDHYALPLLPPLCVAAAAMFARANGALFFAAVAASALLHGGITDRAGNLRSTREMEAIGDAIEAAHHGGCLFIAEGPAWLYTQSPACRLTPYQFPGHLTLTVESRALAGEQQAELARVLDQRPAVIVTRASERDQRSPPIDLLLEGRLARDYAPIAGLPADSGPLLATLTVWQRRDLAAR